MEATSLTHEESSHVAKLLAARAMNDGKNIIWDVTLSTPESATRRLEELLGAGYQRIEGIFVDIPIETSVSRAEDRHRRGHDHYLAGDGLGGRFLSEHVTRSQADNEFGTLNRRAFESIKDRLDYWAIYDNSVDGRPPVLIAEGGATLDNDDTRKPK